MCSKIYELIKTEYAAIEYYSAENAVMFVLWEITTFQHIGVDTNLHSEADSSHG